MTGYRLREPLPAKPRKPKEPSNCVACGKTFPSSERLAQHTKLVIDRNAIGQIQRLALICRPDPWVHCRRCKSNVRQSELVSHWAAPACLPGMYR